MVSIPGSTIVAGAGRTLASLAGPAAKKLAGKMTFRWRVCRRVRKKVDFTVRWRSYRAWLKTITADELATPGEKIQAPLAQRLDKTLSTSSNSWTSTEGHLSRSLRLVELTYPAIAAALDTSDQTELTERWAQHRSSEVLAVLHQLIGAGAALSAEDLSAVLLQRSKARRSVRLQAFEIQEDTLTSYFENISIPKIVTGQVTTLIGDFGSGKSEAAETWHRTTINALIIDEDAPYPVWLSVHDLLKQSLEKEIDLQLGRSWRHGRGAAIVIDGVDETDAATADYLLESARRIAATYTNIQILVTSRPGILSPMPAEEVPMKLLSTEKALELVELAGGSSMIAWNWTADLRATVTRPLFALAAGTKLGHRDAPHGEADLIRNLVEDALEKGAERSAVTSKDTLKVLKKLAVGLTRTGKETLDFSDRQIARSSRLIADRHNGTVVFTLPIFQQWFAAQAILAGDVPAEEVVRDRHSFSQWRSTATIALISETAPDTIDKLMRTWVTGNPGAAAWILKETFGTQPNSRAQIDDELDPGTSEDRLIMALSTWTGSLGPLGALAPPIPMVQDSDRVQLKVDTSGRFIILILLEINQKSRTDNEEQSTAILSPTPGEGNILWRAIYTIPRGEAWPWILVCQMIAEKTPHMLSNIPFLGEPDGVWAHERRFDLARKLLDKDSSFQGEIPSHTVKERALELFDSLNQELDELFQFPFSRNTAYWGIEFQKLATWIKESGCGVITSQLPPEDIMKETGPWPLIGYSPDQIRKFVAELYSRACDAYDEALRRTFRKVDWSMSSSALSPFGAIIEMPYATEGIFGKIPGITIIRVPMEIMPNRTYSKKGDVWSASGRVVVILPSEPQVSIQDRMSKTIENIYSWLSKKNREPIAGVSWTAKASDYMSNPRPASSIAASWLWDDLKIIGLAKGITSPKLH